MDLMTGFVLLMPGVFTFCNLNCDRASICFLTQVIEVAILFPEFAISICSFFS